ncbi:hypothetical protein GF336_07055 [Candidatus Woesearchaeota archaeon]|nr:hypothetical protein [Candidatus Woesearchaeota archaeon]
MKTKSQTEIIGLVIIVILFSLAILFALFIIAQKESASLKQDYTHKELASNLLRAALQTTTDCRGLEITQLLQDCANDNQGGIIYCEAKDMYSCEYANETMAVLLNKTLIPLNKDFELSAELEGDFDPLHVSRGVCTGEKISSSPCCSIPTDAGILNIRLDICN